MDDGSTPTGLATTRDIFDKNLMDARFMAEDAREAMGMADHHLDPIAYAQAKALTSIALMLAFRKYDR